uniref:Flocculation protein FLO11-like n=1 Tax=Salarias fasciatus TaxID=181472 RepID=A0A672H533_SALFA
MLLSHLPVLVLLGAVAAELNTTDGTGLLPTALMNSSSPDDGWTNTSDAPTSTPSATAVPPATSSVTIGSTHSAEPGTTAEPVSPGSQTENSTAGAATSAGTSHPATASQSTEATAAPTAGNDTTVMTDTTQPTSSAPTAATQSTNVTTPPGVTTENFTSPNSSSATPQTPALPSTVSTIATPTAGPPPSTPASSSLPPSSSPGSSTVPSTGNTTTLIPSTTSANAATSGATGHGATTDGSTTASSFSPPSPDTAVTMPRPTEASTSSFSPTAEPPFTTSSPSLVCPWAPCPSQSTCLNSTCQCLSGSILQDGQCLPGRVFPLQLRVPKLEFQSEMSNRSSRIFQNTSAVILAELRKVLRDQPGYVGSDIVQLQPGSVVATVNNVFQNTSVSEDDVDRLFQKAIDDSVDLFSGATVTVTNLCESAVSPCDVSTTTCTSPNGVASCSCKEGYIVDVYSTSSCKACPSGQQAVGTSCQPCSFGYAGFNCNDSSLLAVVVLSCVLGGILLILVLALLAYCCWRLCSKNKSDYGSSPYSSDDLNQPWPTGVTPIPRASTNWSSTPSIELTEGGSTNTLVDKKPQSNGLSASYDLNPEAMKTFKGKNTSRYSYLVQGHENPYFLPGDEKKD